MKEWYNGYVVYSDNGKMKHTFYNPYNVMNYLRDCLINETICDGKRYWAKTGPSEHLKCIFSAAKKQISSLMSLNIT